MDYGKEPVNITSVQRVRTWYRNACVMSKVCHAAGYGGYGSLMGSKNLKAVAAKGRRVTAQGRRAVSQPSYSGRGPTST